MTFWIDGDSCPRTVRDLVGRTAVRLGCRVGIVANRAVPFDPSHPVDLYQASSEEGAADEVILSQAQGGDLVVTRDIPLAARLLEKGVTVLNDRGDVFSSDSIRERLSLRDFSLGLRQNGLAVSGGNNYGKKEYECFARSLDREVTRLFKKRENH